MFGVQLDFSMTFKEFPILRQNLQISNMLFILKISITAVKII